MNVLSCFDFPCFTHEQVKEINKQIKKELFLKEQTSMAARDATKTGNFYHIPCLPLMDLLYPWLNQCQQINRDCFGYDVYWDFHLESFNYNIYEVGGEYQWHVDGTSSNKAYDIKLTCILNLSEEPYEGGEFNMTGAGNIKFTSGMGLVIHPLIAHKVTPVTKGERITLSYWGVGPSWK